MTDHERDSVIIDVRYALRQLRRFGDVFRAIDALERVEALLCPLRSLDEVLGDDRYGIENSSVTESKRPV